MNKIAMTTQSQTPMDLIVIRPDIETNANFVGISSKTAGAKALSMCLVIMPPGAVAKPHLHPNHETAIYLLKGRVELRYGQHLEHCQICEAGDFIFTPPGMPHQPRNLSATEPVYVLASRNDPDEQEQTVPYDSTVQKL